MVNPLLIKSGSIILGGGTATAGRVTCVVYRQEIQKFLDKQFSGTKNTSGSSAFVIIKAKTAADDSITKELYEANGSKNFNCVLNDQTTTAKADYSKDKYFVIDLKKSTKKDISDFNQKTVIVTESNNTEVAKFSFVSALLDDGAFSETTSKTIILS